MKSKVVKSIADIASDVNSMLSYEEIKGMPNLFFSNSKVRKSTAYIKIRKLAVEVYDIDVNILWELIRQLRKK